MSLQFELRGDLLMLRCTCCGGVHDVGRLPKEQRYIQVGHYIDHAREQGWRIDNKNADCPGCVKRSAA